jgi:hypothetical protein
MFYKARFYRPLLIFNVDYAIMQDVCELLGINFRDLTWRIFN